MPIPVFVEGKKVAEFPDGTDQKVIDTVMQRDFFGKNPAAPQPEVPPEKTAGGFFKNVVNDASQVTKGLIQALAHPQQTFEGTADVLAGSALKALPPGVEKPGQLENRQALEAKAQPVIEDWKQKIKHPLDYAYERPVSAGLDVWGAKSMVYPESLTRKLFPKTSEKLSNIHPVKKFTDAILGKATSKGAASFDLGPGQKGFFKQLWGDSTGEELVRKAQIGLRSVLSKGKGEYRKAYNKMKNVSGPANFAPIGQALQESLDELGINYRPPSGGAGIGSFKRLVDGNYPKGSTGAAQRTADMESVFGMSSIPIDDWGTALDAIQTVHKWGKARNALTPRGMDILKRRFGGMASGGTEVDVMISKLYDATKESLTASFPEYKGMMESYSNMKEMQTQIGKALSIKDDAAKKVSVDTALRKLLTTIREDNEFRRSLLKEISTGSAKDLPAEIAGYNLRPLAPSVIHAYGLGLSSYITHHPELMAALAVSSPRLSGTIMHTLRTLEQGAKQVPGKGAMGQAAFQSGRASEQAQGDHEMDVMLQRYRISSNDDKESLLPIIRKKLRGLPADLRKGYAAKFNELLSEK